MTPRLISAFTLFAALGSGVMAGLFFVFSVSVMRALGSLPPAHGIASMNAINQAIPGAWFGVAFFGTALACLALFVLALMRWSLPGTAWLLAGAAIYLAGSIGVTIAVNVPLNNALAAAVPGSDEAQRLWATYLTDWTRWNHLRTVACLAAAACLTIAFRR
ncbi:MAG: anthrone oxygenase family protein [Burkholderiales bacterium]